MNDINKLVNGVHLLYLSNFKPYIHASNKLYWYNYLYTNSSIDR